jgi:hypothetical protein
MRDDQTGLRYRGNRDHVESFFLKATSPDAKRAIWVKATVLASGAAPEKAIAEGWAIAFDQRAAARHVAVKHTLPLDHASFHGDRLAIDWHHVDGGLRLEQAASTIRTSGSIRTGEHAIAWDLALTGAPLPLELLPHRWLYRSPLPSSKTITPVPDARASGHVMVNDERWELVDWHAMQGHNWGKRHGEYGWVHCNAFDVPDLVVEAVSARLRIGSFVTPFLTSAVVRHRGRDHVFSLPHSLWSATSEVEAGSYRFSARGPAGKLSAEATAPVDHFVGLRYTNPDGSGIACLNSKLARMNVRLEPVGEQALSATSHAAALEIGTARDDHGVRMHV